MAKCWRALAPCSAFCGVLELDLHDLARAIIEVPAPPIAPDTEQTDWRLMARHCRDHAHLLSAKERNFIDNLVCWRGEPTEKQLTWLLGIYDRLRRGAA